MRILLVTQYFWPEPFFINELVKTLAEIGHEVTVLTGKPNYPEGEVYQGYEKDGCLTETFVPNVRIFRVPLYPRKKGNALALIRNYLSFVFNGLKYFHQRIQGESFDVVLAMGFSPILSVIPAIWLKWRLKLPLAVWIQDLWPESLSATGFVKNRFLLWKVGLLVRAIYSASDCLLMQSEAFRTPLSRYADPEKLVYYPNSWKVPPEEKETALPSELDDILSNHFCLVFAGNLGTAQALDILIEAAFLLRHLSDFRLVFVGSGSQLKWLQEQKRNRNLENIFLAGRLPSLLMPKVFSKAKGLLVSLKKEPIFSLTIPSKVQAYLSSGKPVIASLDGEGARIIEEAKAGFSATAEDVSGLVTVIEKLYHLSPEERDALGASAEAYFREHFEMTGQAHRLVELLSVLIDEEEVLCKKRF